MSKDFSITGDGQGSVLIEISGIRECLSLPDCLRLIESLILSVNNEYSLEFIEALILSVNNERLIIESKIELFQLCLDDKSASIRAPRSHNIVARLTNHWPFRVVKGGRDD